MVQALINFKEQLLAAVDLAQQPNAPVRPSEDACRFCKAKATCSTRRDSFMDLLKYEFKAPSLLSTAEVAAVLAQAQGLSAWVKDLEEHLFAQALSGQEVPGYKLVAGRSTRKVSDEQAALAALVAAGFKEKDVLQTKLVGIGALEKLVGKKEIVGLLDGLIEKTESKPTLVLESDKRPAVSLAQLDFAKEEN